MHKHNEQTNGLPKIGDFQAQFIHPTKHHASKLQLVAKAIYT